ncbi:hypothetical protein IC232_03460 [Microvirga sp. BT688]|uniref:hypothetical protein n=1 Tax=Microvirga sp. TaxID=1873136 RepID=UPI001683565A|nr:hypothetical protein [Microvirga sp.]MBD2745747.1 hypothetical protein [Microvirga sp.]
MGTVFAVLLVAIADRWLCSGRAFGLWSAAALIVWSLAVQASESALPVDHAFWLSLLEQWNRDDAITHEGLAGLLAAPAVWLGFAGPAGKAFVALSKRAGGLVVEGLIYLAASTTAVVSLNVLGAPLEITAVIVFFSGIIGLMYTYLKSKVLGRLTTIDDKIEAFEARQEGSSLRGVNVLALGQSGRPKAFDFSEDENGAETAPAPVAPPQPVVTPVPHVAPASVAPAVAHETEDLTPDPSVWDGVEDEEGDGAAPYTSDLPQDFAFSDEFYASDTTTAASSEEGDQGEIETVELGADMGVDEEDRRTAYMEARKLVEAYHLLVEQAATSDDPVSVREAVSTLADMITNTTQLSRDCLSEMEHPDVIDEWLLAGILDEEVDIERVIYEHFMSPSVESDEFAIPALDGEEEQAPPQPTVTASMEWEIAPSVVLPTSLQEEAKPEAEPEPVLVSAPVEAAQPDVEQRAAPTPFADAELTEDEKSLLDSILEDQDLLENGLRAIAAYDFKPKALSLLSGRVGALLRARWSEVLADVRLQRVFMTVLERVEDDLFERVGARRATCSVRFTTALVPEETETFLLEIGEKLKAGVQTREDYEHLLACRDRVESLSEAFGDVVDDLKDLGQQFRNELDASGRVYAEPLTAVVTELTGVQAIDANSIKRGMGHVLASGLDQHDRDLLDGFIAVAKTVKSLEQRVIMEAMRRQTDVSIHPLYDTVMLLKQEALARARALQDRVTISGGGETRLKNMLLSGGEDAAEVFGKILGSAQEVENYRIDGKSKNALLASLESQMAALKRLTSEHEVEKRELLNQSAANLTSDSIEAHINLLAEVFSARKSAGNHNMVVDADTVLIRLKKGPAQALYRSKDTAFVFCFIYGQNRNDWYIKDAEQLICKSTSLSVSLRQARAQVGDLPEVQDLQIKMRFILVHGNVESGMGMAFSAKQALERPDTLLRSSELDRGLERLQANDDVGTPVAIAANA